MQRILKAKVLAARAWGASKAARHWAAGLVLCGQATLAYAQVTGTLSWTSGVCKAVKEINGPFLTFVGAIMIVVSAWMWFKSQNEALMNFITGLMLLLSIMFGAQTILSTFFGRSLAAELGMC